MKNNVLFLCVIRPAIGLVVVAVGLTLLDQLYPPPIEEKSFAHLVVARDGTPLRAFADEDGIWRYPISIEDVSPNYLDALIHYEDQWFYSHPGVNPFSLLRASWQNFSQQRVISGGSTLTMQVARLLDPHERSFLGKIKQILRAFQLEIRLNKNEILTLYLNRAPFGGPIEGVQAASFTYFGKSAEMLSDAEAALMAVLPQAPSRNRPDRYSDRAKKMRDKVLQRLLISQVWSEKRVSDAKQEPVWAQYYTQPMHAPLLSRRLISQRPDKAIYQTTIDANLQIGISDYIKRHALSLPKGTSAAVLLMENRSLAVRAYVGAADFQDHERFGHVDMVQAIRSPGSTLKPFIYGMALDAGLVHSQSLLIDAPSNFGDYRPQNFDKGFNGPVSVTKALQKSLNVPAIQVLDKLGDNKFLSNLKNAGLRLNLPAGAKANLALGLGGVGTNLESLVGAYSALVNNGKSGNPRFLQSDRFIQGHALSEGSAWIIHDILMSHSRPDRPAGFLVKYDESPLAWKTGTSYGFRDSWAVGVTPDYTIGVWVGRPDGTPLPGYYGVVAAAPILFSIADTLPEHIPENSHYPDYYSVSAPSSVSKNQICWPLGGLVGDTPIDQCHRTREAWLLDGNTPRTFPDSEETWNSNPISFYVNTKNNKRVDSSCMQESVKKQSVALWPKTVEAWVEAKYRRHHQIPDFDKRCNKPPNVQLGEVKIVGIQTGSIVRPVGNTKVKPFIELHALGGQGRHYWFINDKLEYILDATSAKTHEFNSIGHYKVVVIDEQGKSDEVTIVITDS